ncbi:MAG: hypothetical protein ACLP7F_24535 [Acidimicrobiales bacterium]
MAELKINAADIAEVLRRNLENFTPGVTGEEVGRIREIGDGIARITGLPNVAVNELLELEGGVTALALNLDEDSIGAVILGETGALQEGQLARATGRILTWSGALGPRYNPSVRLDQNGNAGNIC